MSVEQVNNESTMSGSPLNRFDDESQGNRLLRKAKEAPFVPIGLGGLMGVVLYGAYKFKNRGEMSTSVYLMQLRVAAQGTVVACLTAGLVYSMVRHYIFHADTPQPHHRDDHKKH